MSMSRFVWIHYTFFETAECLFYQISHVVPAGDGTKQRYSLNFFFYIQMCNRTGTCLLNPHRTCNYIYIYMYISSTFFSHKTNKRKTTHDNTLKF